MKKHEEIFSRFQQNRLLNDLTTFGIGGAARYFVEVKSLEEMRAILCFCNSQQLPYFILGKGSNCLFDDKGYNGLIISNRIQFQEKPADDLIHVGAGVSFSLLGSQTARQGWAGLEFASGIPGSVGGAVFMNAGANGQETSYVLDSVDFVNDNGDLLHLKRSDIQFGYRFSSFQEWPGAITGATFRLVRSETARENQLKIIEYRKKTQPYNEKSAGCVFVNPQCGHAGKLIEECGLKGMTIGGAQVSSIHANFIVNTGGASSKDVLTLIEVVKKIVNEKTGITLISEIRCIPYH